MNRLRSSKLLVLATALIGLAVAIGALSLWLRVGLHRQALRREASVYHAVTVWQRSLEQERLGTLGLAPAEREFALLVLEASRLPDVISVEAFATDGRLAASLGHDAAATPPSADDWRSLRALQPLARFSTTDALALDVLVPLHEPEAREVTGAVRYAVNAEGLRREFAELDRHLAWQALTIWAAGSGTMLLALGFVFRRLRRAELDLLARTADLENANRELAFAAKTSALGALAAHLVHGLRNPVAGLAALPEPAAQSPEVEAQWREASAAARRIRQMVEEVVTLLRDENSSTRFEVTLAETLEDVARSLADFARARGGEIRVAPAPAGAIDNRTAGLCGAILRNLARNACEVLPPGGELRLACTADRAALTFTVEDNGPGLAPAVAAQLFQPTTSTKPDGAGIGLAISRQLAQHLGAELAHEAVAPHGARFRLTIPRPLQP